MSSAASRTNHQLNAAMTSGLPMFLVTELRFAFRDCTHQLRSSSKVQTNILKPRRFHTCVQKQFPRGRSNSNTERHKPTTNEAAEPQASTQSTSSSSTTSPIPSAQSRDLVPRGRDGRAISTPRTVGAPMRIVPKADITPNLKLTPKERLHIEILTRRAPPVVKQLKTFKERLLIYHHGNVAENALIFLKVLGLVCAGTVTMIIVPAHYAAGSSFWLCGSLLLGGWFPSIFFHHLLKPLATRIHLRLPPNARASPEAAMKYAKNLPSSAQLDISFNRITALPGTVTVNVADLQPIPKASQWPWQTANLRWVGNSVDKGSRFRPNPTEFSVKPSVGPGKAKRDVIPGIWPEVYDRLIGVAKARVSRWKK